MVDSGQNKGSTSPPCQRWACVRHRGLRHAFSLRLMKIGDGFRRVGMHGVVAFNDRRRLRRCEWLQPLRSVEGSERTAANRSAHSSHSAPRSAIPAYAFAAFGTAYCFCQWERCARGGDRETAEVGGWPVERLKFSDVHSLFGFWPQESGRPSSSLSDSAATASASTYRF